MTIPLTKILSPAAGPYIDGILTSDETAEEQREALNDLLTGVTEDSALEHLVDEILSKWSLTQDHQDEAGAKDAANALAEDLDTKLAKLLEANIKTNEKKRIYTEEELKMRSRILEDYGQLSDHAEDEDVAEGGAGGGGGEGGSDSDPDLVRNTNVSDVLALKKERREQSRLESQQKKEKDKEDREKQKKLREEKKEKRKTVKGERRR